MQFRIPVSRNPPGLWLALLSLVAALGAEGRAADPSPAAPTNVILFFVDDMGWTDLGCFGSDLYETPRIDRLAAEGVRFTNAYAACTVCSPSRAALLTGQYPARLRVTDFIPGHPIENTPLLIPEWTQRLELEEVTIAELLRAQGYHTVHLGKWHLTPRDRTGSPNDDGNFPEFYPVKQGFDFNIGGCERGAPASYFWPYGRGTDLESRKDNNVFRTLPEGRGKEGTYLTDQLADEAVRLVKEFGEEPFFLSFPFYNVHTPLQGRPDLVKKYEEKLKQSPPGKRHQNVAYAAMVESVDEAVGRLMDQLEAQGIADRTLVIFSSDNGGLCPQATVNLPLRQGKGSIYEGGVRVPTILWWPGKAKAGGVSDEPIITVDFFPTILEATGTKAPDSVAAKIDGLSLLPLLENPDNGSLERDAIFWHYPHYHMMGGIPYSAIRKGKWKLIERLGDAGLELYNLAEDIHEDRDLVETHGGVAVELHRELMRWRESVGAQMPVANPDYDSAKPTGWKRGNEWRAMATVRE